MTIVNFETETHNLTDYELDVVVPRLIKGFNNVLGRDNAITNSKIRAVLAKEKIEISDARIRKLIHYIRINGLIERLAATSSGYYIANNPGDYKLYIESLKQREAAIRAIRKVAEKDLNKWINSANQASFF